jgi:hypothetical protein
VVWPHSSCRTRSTRCARSISAAAPIASASTRRASGRRSTVTTPPTLESSRAAPAPSSASRARAVVGLDALTAALVEVYEAIAEEERAAPASARAESDALAANLAWLARSFEESVRRESRRRYRARVAQRRWSFRSH